MDGRTHRALDGELRLEDLTQDELAEVGAAQTMIDGVLRAVPHDPVPDLAPAVLARIAEVAPHSGRMAAARGDRRASILLDWLWSPRPVLLKWRPAYALGIMSIVAAVAIATSARDDGAGLAPGAETRQVLVQFRLDAPHATEVSLAGDFTDWQPAHTLTRAEPGIWTVVVPLEPGLHDYAFVVDGERWLPDPTAPAVADGFGGLNSRLAVLLPDEARP